jgi:hypothetical protein
MILPPGKRKRRGEILDQDSNELTNVGHNNSDDLQALFRKHFETQFAPLDEPSQPSRQRKTVDSEVVHDASESDWEGIPYDGSISADIIEYQTPEPRKEEIPPEEFKSFMVSMVFTK